MQSSFSYATLVNKGCLGLASCQSESGQNKVPNSNKNSCFFSSRIYVWNIKLLEVQSDCEFTFKQREKNIFWFVLSVTCQTLIWKATPVPENNIFVLKLMRNTPSWILKEKAYSSFVAVLFNLCSTQWYTHTHRKIFFSYLKSGYIIPEKILLLSFIPPPHIPL